MKYTKGVLCAILAYLFGISSWHVRTAHGKSAHLPDCGQEACVKGYEICIDSRCRHCANFVGTEYGCKNLDTQRECSSFCIDEVSRNLNDTIRSLQEKTSGSSLCENMGMIVFIAILIFLTGILVGIGGTFIFRRYRLHNDQSNTSSEESLASENKDVEMQNFKDSRLTQVPPSDESHHGLISHATTT